MLERFELRQGVAPEYQWKYSSIERYSYDMISHKAIRSDCGRVYGVTGNFLDHGTNPWMNC